MVCTQYSIGLVVVFRFALRCTLMASDRGHGPAGEISVSDVQKVTNSSVSKKAPIRTGTHCKAS